MKDSSQAVQDGIRLFNEGRMAEAVARFAGHLRRHPGDAQTLFYLAHGFSSLGRPKEAERAFRLLGRDPAARPAAALGLAQLLRREGRTKESEAALRSLLRTRPGAADARVELAALLFGVERLPEAEAQLREALKIDPARPQARLLLAKVLRRRGRFEEAAAACRRAVGNRAGWAEADYEWGKSLLELKRGQEAGRRLKRAADAGWPGADVRLELGRLALEDGKPGEAEAWFRAAVAAEPSSAEALTALGEAAFRAGRAREARRLAETAAALGTGGAADHLALSRLLDRLGSREAAVRSLRRALAVDPEIEGAREALGAFLLDQSARYSREAETAFREALKRRFTAPTAVKLARMLLWGGRLDEARAEFSRILEKTPAGGAPERRAARFAAFAGLGRYEEAAREGESLLDAVQGLEGHGSLAADLMEELASPWGRYLDEGKVIERFVGELRRLDEMIASRPSNPWLPYFAVIMCCFTVNEFGKRYYARLRTFDARRYGWMLLTRPRFSVNLIADMRKVLQFRPRLWRAHFGIAEAYLAFGREEQAFAEMRRALRAAPKEERGSVLAASGKIFLWAGRYRRALRELQASAATGCAEASIGLGGALLKLGRAGEALKVLDHAVDAYPSRAEARVWRGEALRLLGRLPEALKELDRAVTLGDCVWALFNRALVRSALGDERGMRRDYAGILWDVRAYVEGKAGVAPGGRLTAGPMKQVLETAFVLSKGNRQGATLTPALLKRGLPSGPEQPEPWTFHSWMR